MTAMRVYMALWIGWALAFVLIEGSALVAGHPQYTLSDFLWRAEGHNWQRSIVWYAIAAAWIWLGPHLLGKWWR